MFYSLILLFMLGPILISRVFSYTLLLEIELAEIAKNLGLVCAIPQSYHYKARYSNF